MGGSEEFRRECARLLVRRSDRERAVDIVELIYGESGNIATKLMACAITVANLIQDGPYPEDIREAFVCLVDALVAFGDQEKETIQ